MNRILESNNSVVENFTLSRETFNKSRISRKEISVYGKMYDIKSFSFYGNLVRLSVIRDKKEEWIICALKNALRDGNEHDNGLLVKIVKLLSLDYTLPSLLQDDFLTYSEKKHLPVLSELLHFRIADILTPPPEAA